MCVYFSLTLNNNIILLNSNCIRIPPRRDETVFIFVRPSIRLICNNNTGIYTYLPHIYIIYVGTSYTMRNIYMSYSPHDLLQLATSQVTPLLQMVRTLLYIIIIYIFRSAPAKGLRAAASAGSR